jgi:hypothetical protein
VVALERLEQLWEREITQALLENRAGAVLCGILVVLEDGSALRATSTRLSAKVFAGLRMPTETNVPVSCLQAIRIRHGRQHAETGMVGEGTSVADRVRGKFQERMVFIIVPEPVNAYLPRPFAFHSRDEPVGVTCENRLRKNWESPHSGTSGFQGSTRTFQSKPVAG